MNSLTAILLLAIIANVASFTVFKAPSFMVS
jgi:hypothetical protein